MQFLNNKTCVEFCYETNFKEYMYKAVKDSYRAEVMACQFNCLNKLTIANDLLEEAVQYHPRFLKNQDLFNSISNEIKNYNQSYANKNI
jgi:hypothetical protein